MEFKQFYQSGSYNLVGSILHHYGLSGPPVLDVLEPYLAKGYRNLFVLILDGLSVELARTNTFLEHHLAAQIYSVFPPTTTASLTTLYSGLSPIEHGWMGWNVRLPQVEHDAVTLFLNTVMDSNQPAADYPVAQTHLAYRTIFDQIADSGVRVLRTSPFDGLPARTVDHILGHFIDHAKQPGRLFGLGYWTEPDFTQHCHGAMSNQAVRLVRDISLSLQLASQMLQDSLLIVMSDHGMINSQAVYLEDWPELMELLERPFSFEARNPSLFIKPGKAEQFGELFRRRLPDFDLYDKATALQLEIYGPGEPHPTTEHSIGDFIAIARDGRHLVLSRQRDSGLKGLHAGLTREEMMIPLIILECP